MRAFAFAVCGLGGAALAPPGVCAAGSGIDVRLEAGRVSLRAESATLAEVLAEIARTVGFELVLKGDWEEAPRLWQLGSTPLSAALRRLTEAHVSVMIYPRPPGPVPLQLRVYRGAGGGRVGTDLPAPTGAGAAAGSAPVRAEGSVALGEALRGAPGPEQRSVAIVGLERHGGEGALDELETGLDDPDPAVRVEVVDAIGWVGGPRAIALLGDLVATDPDPDVRIAAVAALATMYGPGVAAFLSLAASDPDEEVRRSAALAARALRE